MPARMEDQAKDLYDILGVSRAAKDIEVRAMVSIYAACGFYYIRYHRLTCMCLFLLGECADQEGFQNTCHSRAPR